MRLLLNLIALTSLLLAVAAGLLWADSHATWRTAYVRTGGAFWRLDSAVGSFAIDCFSGWPDPPRAYFRAVAPDVYNGFTPVFGISIGGARRTTWEAGGFSLERGTVCVPVGSDGTADFGSPAIPALQSILTAKLSPPFPFWSVGVPWWSLVILFLLPPGARGVTIAGRHLRRRRRRSRGRCPECGYDVRQSPARCTECGTTLVASRGDA